MSLFDKFFNKNYGDSIVNIDDLSSEEKRFIDAKAKLRLGEELSSADIGILCSNMFMLGDSLVRKLQRQIIDQKEAEGVKVLRIKR